MVYLQKAANPPGNGNSGNLSPCWNGGPESW